MQNYLTGKGVHRSRLIDFLTSMSRQYHIRHFAKIIFSILIAQITVWLLFETFLEKSFPISLHLVTELVFLTFTLVLILVPILYRFSYRPLLQSIEKFQIAQKQLESLNEELLISSNRERQAHQLAEVLLSANQSLSKTLDLDSIAKIVLDFMFDFVPYDTASILIPTTVSTWTVLKSVHCESGTKIEVETPKIIDEEGSLYLKAFLNEKRSMLISDTQSYNEWPPWMERKESHSWLGLPFIVNDSVIAICELDKVGPNFFTAEHVKLAEMFTHVAATALQNAWLFEQVRSGRERLKMLSHRLVNIQERERQYISRELHDEVGQALALLLMRLRLLERNIHCPEAVLAGIKELERMLDNVSEGLHRLAVGLRPVSLDHLGIIPALQQHVEEFSSKHNIKTQFEAIDLNGRLPLDVETAVYRIVQEGLTNIVRHGQATQADIVLRNRDNKLVVIIEDNGIGFIPETINKSEHLGLVGIAERAEMFNGNMTIESTPGVGTTLLVEVSYEPAHPNN